MNLVILKGNLARDPELRYTAKGTCIANVSVAVSHKWKDANGEQKEETGFFEVVAWGRRAEVVGQYFKKGKPILVQGRLRQESWDDKTTGKKRYAVKVVMDGFEFCGGDKTGPNEERSQADAPGGGAEAPQQDAAEDEPPF